MLPLSRLDRECPSSSFTPSLSPVAGVPHSLGLRGHRLVPDGTLRAAAAGGGGRRHAGPLIGETLSPLFFWWRTDGANTRALLDPDTWFNPRLADAIWTGAWSGNQDSES